jgi:hypothetical protein
MRCDVILMIFAYQTKLNISGRTKKRLYQRGYIVILAIFAMQFRAILQHVKARIFIMRGD